MRTETVSVPRNWQALTPHPLSALVEFGAGIDVGALTEHIKQHGYDTDEAIIIYEGMILDGRHKHAAAVKSGIVPRFRRFVGKNATAYVSKKLFRQHLNTSQRAMMAETLRKILTPSEGGNEAQNCARKPTSNVDNEAQNCAPISPSEVDNEAHECAPAPTQREAAKAMNVSRRAVQNAAKVQDSGTPELNQAVMDGTVAVDDAAKVAGEPPEVQNAAVEAVRNGEAATAAKATKKKNPPPSVPETNGQHTPPEAPPTVEEQMKAANASIESFCRGLLKYVQDNLPLDDWLNDDNAREGAIRKFEDGCSMLRRKKCSHLCPNCKGTKEDGGKKCRPCHGTGRVPKAKHDQMI